MEQLKAIIAQYPNADDYVWAQEEPKNMGAYSFMLMNFNLIKWRLASLKAYSAPASGSYTRAKRRQADAIKMVFDKGKNTTDYIEKYLSLAILLGMLLMIGLWIKNYFAEKA